MLEHSLVGDIRLPSDGVEDIKSPLPGTGNLRAYVSDGSRWIHTDAVIRITSEINNNSVKTLLTPEGDVPITVSPSINVSTRLV